MQESKLDLQEKFCLGDESEEEKNSDFQRQRQTKVKSQYYSQERILKGTNLFSRMFFSWISKVLTFGNTCQIETDDLPQLHSTMHPKIEFQHLRQIMEDIPRSSRKGWTLFKAIAKAYCSYVLVLGLLSLIITLLTMTAPILTHQIITYVKKETEERQMKQVVWLIIGIVFITFGKAIMQSHLYYKFAIFGFNLSNTLSLLLYEKSLKYPALCEKKYSIPEIINYSQVDAQRMTAMGFQLTSVLYTPLQIIIGVWLMYSYIGFSFVFGMGTMIFMIGLTFLLAKRMAKVNEVTLRRKDERMKKTEEMLDLIRFIKINAFEKYFYREVDEKRREELQSNRKRGLLEVSVTFLYFLSCPLIIFLTFFAYIHFGNSIDSSIVFSTIMIFNILQSPLRNFPSALSSMIQISASIVRIEEFLLAKEIQSHYRVSNDSEAPVAIWIENGTFGWGTNETLHQKQNKVYKEVELFKKTEALKINQSTDEEVMEKDNLSQLKSENNESSLSLYSDESDQTADSKRPLYVKALKDINCTIQKGRFLMVLGDVGSGKSSFLLSILNEMNRSERSIITLNGSVAYVAQKPWIMNATVRDNITFWRAFSEKKFREAVEYSSLKPDLKLLVKGEETEIGEKGLNLSGGQKARISLARAIYSQRDILLLDDIISAVDVHVAEFIIKQTILTHLKGKTIVLATHAAKFAQYADEIMILKKGVIVRKGTFRDVRQTQQFKQLYQIQLKKQKESVQSPQDKQVLQDEMKMREALTLILEQKKAKQAKINEIDLNPKSFTERAVEELIIPEDHRRGSIEGEVLKQYVKFNGGSIFVLVVFGTMTGWLCLSIFSNIQMQLWCQDQTHNQSYLYTFMILSAVASFCTFVRAYTLVHSGFKQGQKVHKKIVQALLYASLNQFYLRVPVGRIMNRLTKDLRDLDETIANAMGIYLTNMFSLLGTLCICIYGSTPFMVIPTVLVIFLCNKLRQYYMKTQREVLRIEAKTNSPIVSGFVSAIHGLSTIRAYKMEREFMEDQIRRVEINKGARITREALESWFAFRLSLLSFAISVISIVLALIDTGMSPALVGLLLSYAFNLNDDIISLTFSWANIETKMISVERIHNFMYIEPEKSYEGYCCENWSEVEEGFCSIIEHGQIQFKNVSVRYRADLPCVLNNVSFAIRAGQKVGIVGRTGAGKSTILASLLRLIEPCSGEILVDSRNISHFFIKDLRNAITMIDQEPTLIRGTFRENLDIHGIYTDDQLYALLKQCNLYERVMEKDGLNQVIDNNSLSVGEKQLVCICRAFLKKSKVVIIDQGTANIDMKNDEVIQRVIRDKFQQSTVITIAHRLSTLNSSDLILVLGEGRILEFGSPIELESRQGIYAEMLRNDYQ